MEAADERLGAGEPVDGGRSVVAALGVSAAPVGADRTPAGGRQRRVAGGRSRRVEVRLTDAEYETLAARAGAVGVSVPRFLVECGLDTGGLSPGERRAKFAACAGLPADGPTVGPASPASAHLDPPPRWGVWTWVRERTIEAPQLGVCRESACMDPKVLVNVAFRTAI